MRNAGRVIFRNLHANLFLPETSIVANCSQKVRYISRASAANNFMTKHAGKLTGAAVALVTGLATFTWVENKSLVSAAESERPKHKLAREVSMHFV